MFVAAVINFSSFLLQCSVTCGLGTKMRSLECSDKDISCDFETKPLTTERCDLKACPRWNAGLWGEVRPNLRNTAVKRRRINSTGRAPISRHRTLGKTADTEKKNRSFSTFPGCRFTIFFLTLSKKVCLLLKQLDILICVVV